ncbi:MAG: hypothetical protein AAGG08_04515 [Actinomycetota bacterium]
MTTVDGDAAAHVDGRAARRQRNVDAVLDVVIEMIAEEQMFPSIEQAATRSGLSLRSLYRYFADPGELMEAVIERHEGISRSLAHLPHIGDGALDERIDDFVEMRLRVHDGIGGVLRATLANAPRHLRIREQLATARTRQRDQFRAQFAPELSRRRPGERNAVVAAGDLLTQVESIDFLRRHRQLTIAETTDALTTGLLALLD